MKISCCDCKLRHLGSHLLFLLNACELKLQIVTFKHFQQMLLGLGFVEFSGLYLPLQSLLILSHQMVKLGEVLLEFRNDVLPLALSL